MKTIFFVILAIFLSTAAYGEDVEYEITIKVTYNAVTPERADEIIGDAMRRHKDACDVDVQIEKVGGSDMVDFTAGDIDGLTFLPGSSYYGDTTGSD